MEKQNNQKGNSLLLLDEMKKFIACSRNGKRRMPSGARLKPGTIVNYEAVLAVLEKFQIHTGVILLIPLAGRENSREFK